VQKAMISGIGKAGPFQGKITVCLNKYIRRCIENPRLYVFFFRTLERTGAV
jgi:hypothetical protein